MLAVLYAAGFMPRNVLAFLMTMPYQLSQETGKRLGICKKALNA